MRTTQTDKPQTLRAVGYCRTSGEGQRDNTSIPRQKEAIEEFINRNGWHFICHYVDESISGKKVEGRDAFQQMMKDAANEEFDIIVPYDVTRFARDGCDIISNSSFLKKTFGVDVVDTKSFDTRDRHRIIANYTQAGVAEWERLNIMERTIGGRIEKARNGLPWARNLPVGRGYDKDNGNWYITEHGYKLSELLTRYADGERLKLLAIEYGIKSAQTITRNVREGQLSGTYYANFHSPEIGINHLRVKVPGMPEVISPELERRVRDRMAHNKKWNKQHKRKYVLSGLLECTHCGKSLKGQTLKSGVYYRHNNYLADDKRDCPYCSIRGDLLESHVLDYLYNFFLDEPAYNKAIKAALPSGDDRKALEKDIKLTEGQIAKAKNKLSNLVNAVAAGADVKLLLDKQDELKATIRALERRRDELNQTLASMPDPDSIKKDAMLLRIYLIEKHKGKDWRKASYDDVRKFLHFLFSDNPKKRGYGIFVGKQNGRWHITFKGCAEFYHDVIDGRPVSYTLSKAADRLNAEIKSIYEKGIDEANSEYEEMSSCTDGIKPNKVNNRTARYLPIRKNFYFISDVSTRL
ncbi:MAG: recombinase family protein [Phycisphaerae bacterium]